MIQAYTMGTIRRGIRGMHNTENWQLGLNDG